MRFQRRHKLLVRSFNNLGKVKIEALLASSVTRWGCGGAPSAHRQSIVSYDMLIVLLPIPPIGKHELVGGPLTASSV